MSVVRVSIILFAGEESVAEPNEKSQANKFRDLARELECDEDEAKFEETVRQIAPKDSARPEADQPMRKPG